MDEHFVPILSVKAPGWRIPCGNRMLLLVSMKPWDYILTYTFPLTSAMLFGGTVGWSSWNLSSAFETEKCSYNKVPIANQ